MMKIFATCLFVLLNFTCFGQTVNLQWKIAENEKLNYLTVMSDIDTSKIEFNFGGFFKSFSDSSGKGMTEIQDFFKQLNQSMQNIDYVSTLTSNGKEIIDIVMSTRAKDPNAKQSATEKTKEDELLKMMQTMNQGVMLRGSVYATGGIHSFWVKSTQKNLIAMLFELPTGPVKVGDTWKLDIDLIANDQNFQCDSSYKINEVTLTEIKKVNGENIAVLKYNVVEYVNGVFNAPGFMGGAKQKTMMKFALQGLAEFSIDKGRWVTYDGILALDTTGVMATKKKTKFSLLIE